MGNCWLEEFVATPENSITGEMFSVRMYSGIKPLWVMQELKLLLNLQHKCYANHNRIACMQEREEPRALPSLFI